MLGDPAKVRFVALTAQNRFTALQSGEIDVLYRNSTETYLRGVSPGSDRGGRAGVTANAEDMSPNSQTPAIQRLLGTAGELGSRLGLDNRWMVSAVKAGGNYGELFERNVGTSSALKLSRSLNGLWSKGGLMYTIPFK